ncbi:MAG: glutathione peroxidase [Flavobacteriaceae bacterium]|nr:glutathione peroxidase [Bacteroidia bacterium]NND09568.1 glutathione peroxidase [Flavobacteriaceae bacterium]NNL60062.1 glutathione peroxidase [Flavobacteriaceae bacterium]
MRLIKSSVLKKPNDQEQTSIYDIEINDLSGNPINLKDFQGKYLLFVNVASKCGFTSQYKALQSLHDNYNDKLMVIGVPCNQFGGQEPGTAEDIGVFCERNYGVSFLMTEKINVKGTNQHPLYSWLTTKGLNGKSNSSVKWNFQKYLVGQNGKLINHYLSITGPMSNKITKHLN